MGRSLPAALQIRNVLPSDVPSLAELLVSAPDDGSLYKFPHIQEYPEEMHELHLRWLRPAVLESTVLIRVAVVTEGDHETVVGFSSWQKNSIDPADGKAKPVELWQPPPPPDSGTSDTANKSTATRALVPNKQHSDAVRRCRARAPPSPAKTRSTYELNGLAVRPSFRGYGIGSVLVQWGLERAEEEGLPVFVAGEARGVDFYEKALRFQRLKETEYWLDANGVDISREQVMAGNEEWKTEQGGLSGAEMVWCPTNYTLEIQGQKYSGLNGAD